MTIFTNINQTNSGGSDIDIEKIANTDLSNLTAIGETRFANKSLSNIDALGQAKFLNKQMITNCLISATSGLVTASEDTLTVPSGLIFLIPNGVDATTSMIKNIETSTSIATTFTEKSSQHGTRVLFYNSDNTLTSYLQSEIEYDNILKYWKANGSKIIAKNLATYYWDGSHISSFIPEQVATIEMSSMGAVLDTKANISFDNLVNTAKNIANWSSNITNCLTQIPQDVKLELNDGVLTLKAGSKVYNGDGTVYTISTDYTPTQSLETAANIFVFPVVNDTQIIAIDLISRSLVFSGNVAPTFSGNYAYWFDTTTKRVKYTNNAGTSWSEDRALPMCLASTTNNKITSIDQIFNGFGYIGSTVFALPGVKGLTPNGRNEDGTLKSIQWMTNTVLTSQINPNDVIGMCDNKLESTGAYKYNSQKNQNLNNDSFWDVTTIGKCLEDGTIALNKSVFHAVDYNSIIGIENSIIGINNNIGSVSGLPGDKTNLTDAIIYTFTNVGGKGTSLPLIKYDWFEYLLNDPNWIRCDTFSWHSGDSQEANSYEKVYQHLVDDIDSKTLQSETVAGITIQYYLADDTHKICPTSEEQNLINLYNTTGIAWYYIIDTENIRFKLPRTKWGFTGLRDVVGKYVPESLPNVTGAISCGVVSQPHQEGALYKEEDKPGFDGSYTDSDSTMSRLMLNASRSSSTYQDNAPVQQRATQMYLYCYIGGFAQTSLENIAGQNMSIVNLKADTDLNNVSANIDFVIDSQEPTAENNYTWYRLYKSGWVEQGGCLLNANTGAHSITIPIKMASIEELKKSAIATPIYISGIIQDQGVSVRNSADSLWSTTQLACYSWGSVIHIKWEVKGTADLT